MCMGKNVGKTNIYLIIVYIMSSKGVKFTDEVIRQHKDKLQIKLASIVASFRNDYSTYDEYLRAIEELVDEMKQDDAKGNLDFENEIRIVETIRTFLPKRSYWFKLSDREKDEYMTYITSLIEYITKNFEGPIRSFSGGKKKKTKRKRVKKNTTKKSRKSRKSKK